MILLWRRDRAYLDEPATEQTWLRNIAIIAAEREISPAQAAELLVRSGFSPRPLTSDK
jgi:hypothetical protein